MPKGVKGSGKSAQPAAPPVAEPEVEAAQVRQEQQVRDLSGARSSPVIDPGGRRKEHKYLGIRVAVNDQTKLLGDPTTILKPDRVKRGFVYCWAKRDNNATSAFMRSGWYHPVSWDDLAPNPDAFVQMIEMPGGPNPEDAPLRYIAWGSLILCAMPVEVWTKIYKAAEEKAYDDQAAMNMSLADRIQAQLQGQGIVNVETKDFTRETVQIAAGAAT